MCKFAYWNGFVVGAACCRLESLNKSDNNTAVAAAEAKSNDGTTTSSSKKQIYIMTLGVLAAYRGRQIGTQLIQSVLDYFESHMMDDELKNVVEISLHVQISNEDAIKFYTERFGFEKDTLNKAILDVSQNEGTKN